MTRKMKKALSLIIAILMVLSSVPVGGFGSLDFTFATKASALDARGSLGENITYTFNETTGAVTITGSGDMPDYSQYESPFWNNGDIKSVTIGENITSIGNYLFASATSLESVTLPTTLKKIGNGAFRYNYSLKSIILPEGLETICEGAFYNCKFSSIVIPKGVKTIEPDAFCTCHWLTDLTVDPDNENYTSVDNVLFNKDKTTLVWYSCANSAESYTIPAGVKTIAEKAFYGNLKIKSIIMTDDVETIGKNAFESCSSLTSVTLSNKLTTIPQYAFDSCKFKSIIIPEGVTKIESSAFSNCSNLETIMLPSTLTDINDSAFNYNSALSNVCYTGTEETWNKITIGYSNDKLKNAERHYVDATKKIGDNVYYDFDSTSGVLTVFGIGDMYDFDWNTAKFQDIKNDVKSIVISNGVTSIGELAFAYCTSNVENISIAKSVTKIGDSAFMGCSKLTSLVIPDGVKSIESNAFRNGHNIESLTLYGNLTSIADSAFGMDAAEELFKLESIYYCGTAEQYEALTIGEYNDFITRDAVTVYFCPTGKLGNNVTYTLNPATGVLTVSGTGNTDYYWANETSGNSPLYGNKNIKKIVIESGVTGINDAVFAACGVEEVTFSDTVKSIGIYAFLNCTALKGVVIPSSVETIGYGAFSGTTNLKDVYYIGTEEAWNSITINSNNDPLINANIIFNHTHSVSNYVVVKNGTCENGGTRNGMCVCGMCVETETISTAHSFGDVQHKDVDCVNDGYDYKQCTDCKKYFPSDAAVTDTNGKDDTSSFVTPATGHSDGEDGNDNLCDKCRAYIGDISLRVGTNITVPITYAYGDHDILVKFVPDKTAQYIISSNADPDDQNTWPVITVYSLTYGILEYAANDSNSKTKNFNLSTYTFTAGQVYCISFRNYKENAEAYTVNVALGCEHPSVKQTCMGYYCEACGLYYGRRDSSKHELDTVQTCRGYKCKHCNRYFGDAAPDNHIWDTDGMCTACYTWHDHKTFDENGMCTVCKYALPYVLISGTTTTYYGTFPDALAAAKDGDTIKMQNDDASSYSSVEITKAITLDLNGHALTQPSSESFDVKANVTFTDSVGGSYCEYGIVLYTSCTFSGGGYRYIAISPNFETEDNLGDYLAACCDYYNYSFSFSDGVGTVGSLLDLSSQKNTYDLENGIMIKANHSIIEVNAQETTCTKAGHTAGEYCENCDYTTVTKTGDATGHTFGTLQHKDADCTSGGYDYKQCSNCSKYFASDAAINATNGKDDYSSFTTQKLNHSYTGTIKMDKDGKNGTHSFKCVNGCGQYGGTVAHDWDGGTVTTPATHLNEGVKTFTCTCGATYTEPVSKLEGHTYVPTVVEPTCTEQGYTEHKCACGDSYKDTYVDALGHNYVDGTCDNCGKVQPSDCTCLCHQNTLVKFIYMLLDVILTLLGSGFDCRCGESHF